MKIKKSDIDALGVDEITYKIFEEEGKRWIYRVYYYVQGSKKEKDGVVRFVCMVEMIDYLASTSNSTFFSDGPIFMLELKLYTSKCPCEMPSTTEAQRLGLLCYDHLQLDLLVEEGYRMSLSLQENVLGLKIKIYSDREACVLISQGFKADCPSSLSGFSL